MDFKPSSRPATVIVDGQPQQPAHDTGTTVHEFDQWRRYIAPGKRVELRGTIYQGGDAIELTAAQADELERQGALLPFDKQPKPLAPLATVGRITESDMMTQRHALPPLEGH